MSKINRSTYQKVVQENKKLRADIKLLVEEGMPSAEKIMCIVKWRQKFKEEKEFYAALKQAATNHFNANNGSG